MHFKTFHPYCNYFVKLKVLKLILKLTIKVKMAYHGLLTDREDADDVDSKLNLCRSIYDVR